MFGVSILLIQAVILGSINLYLFVKLGKLFSKTQDKIWIQLLAGYLVLSILFNFWLKVIGYQGHLTIIWVYLLCFFLGTLFNLSQIKNNSKGLVKSVLLILIFISVLGVFENDKNSIALGSSFNYWHSANADIFDGLCGAQTLLLEESVSVVKSTNLGTVDNRTNSLELLPFFSLNGDSLCNSDKAIYLGAQESVQYTNLALFSDLLRLPVSMYVFLFQSVFNLFILFNTLVLFGKKFFSLKKRPSYVFAGISVLSHLYFITFINGHVGSMMIQAPLILLIYLISTKWVETKKYALLLPILTVFISLSYPYILPFIIIYFLITSALLKTIIPSKYQKYRTPIILFLFTLACWFRFSDQREKVEWAERSWGTYLNPLGPLQYLGIMPGNINGSGLLGYSQQWLIKFGITSNLKFWVISMLITIFILGNVIKAAQKSEITLPNKLLLCALGFPLIIAVTSHDSYYTYKVSYIFQFVLIGYLVIRMQQLVVHRREPKKVPNIILSVLTQTLIFIILSLNFFWNIGAAYGVFVSNNQWSSISNSIKNIPAKEINNAILETDSYQVSNISNFEIQKLRPKSIDSLIPPLKILSIASENGVYAARVNIVPADTFLLSGYGFSSNEKESRGNFRWVYEFRTKPKSSSTEYYSMKVIRLNSSKTSVEQSLCVSLPEWDLRKSASLQIVGKEGQILSEFIFSKERTCNSFQIPGNVNILTLRTNLSGESPSLFDTRRFLFRIWDSGVDNQIYDSLG